MVVQLLLGLLVFPMWVAMAIGHFAATEPPIGPVAPLFVSLFLVITGAIGAVGVLLALVRRGGTIGPRTTLMVGVAGVALLTYNIYSGNLTLDALMHDTWDAVLFFFLPIVGFVHLAYVAERRARTNNARQHGNLRDPAQIERDA